MKKLIALLLSVVLALSLCSCGSSPEKIAAENYQKATDLLHTGNYAEALVILRELGDYEDATTMRKSAAYALTREYIKTNGAPHAIQETLNVGNYSYALREEVQPSSTSDGMINNYYRYIAVDDNDQLVMGLSQYVQNAAGMTLWSYYITLSETSNIAKTTYVAADYFAIGDRSMKQIDEGTEELDITTYTEDSDLDMSYDRETTNYLGQVTNETKTISWAKQQHVLDAINAIPLDCQTLLEPIGVTLGDLGFTALDSAPTQENAS